MAILRASVLFLGGAERREAAHLGKLLPVAVADNKASVW